MCTHWWGVRVCVRVGEEVCVRREVCRYLEEGGECVCVCVHGSG